MRTSLMYACLIFFVIFSAGEASARPCMFKPLQQGVAVSPQGADKRTFASEIVRGAGLDVPFTMLVQAKGPINLRWDRYLQATPLELWGRLVVSQSLDGGSSFEGFCDTGWVAAARLHPFAQLELSANTPRTWRVQVFEMNKTPGMTVLDEELTRISLEGAFDRDIKVLPEPIPNFYHVRAHPPAAPLLCSVTKQTDVVDALPVSSNTISVGGLQIDGTAYAISGRTLRVKLERSEAGAPVGVIISAKPLMYGSEHQPVCTIEIEAGDIGEDEWITAIAPWEMVAEFRWKITIRGNGAAPEIKYTVFRERPHSSAWKNIQAHSAAAYSCTNIDSGKQSPVDAMRSEMFQSAHSLTLRTNLRQQGASEEAYRKVIEAMLVSIDSWRVVCTACTAYQFSVIDIDGQVYVPNGMLQGTPENYRATFNFSYPWAWRVFARKSTGLFSPETSFVPVNMTARQRQRFCIQQEEADSRFSPAQSPLCRPSPPGSDQEMVINVEWTKKLSCDNRTTVVACWNGTDLIQLNLQDYAFYVGDTGVPLLGEATKGADLIRVFIHEVGHWLGLAHAPGDGNIMSEELADARCISDLNVRAVNAVARGTVARLHQSEALRYE